jgi:PAS domain S-box-containing protein
MDEIAILKRKLERERKARKQAESILETKALELYKLNEGLEVKIAERTNELRISEDKYRGIIENMELGLLEVDKNQFIIKSYNWFCDMTGYSQEELLGKNAKEFFSFNSDADELVEIQNDMRKKGQAGVYEVKIRHKTGRAIWVLVSGSPIYDVNGKITGSIGIHYDITQRKELETELVEAKQAAELAQEAEKQFLAQMSHEIRTPLNAIIGMSHLLQDSKPTNEQQEYLSILSKSSNILKLLISDILDFSKIQAGEIDIKIKEFDIIQLVENLHKTTELKIGDKDILVSYEIDSRINNFVLGDELLLNQILINLLGNAGKFTNEGEVGIIVKVLNEGEDKLDLEFQVFDTGIGIPKAKQKLIFENFKQIDDNKSTQQKFDGTGLGLAITKKLVEIQGGNITVKSAINQRTTFTFNLTYQKSGKIVFGSSKENEQSLSTLFKKVELLVVEDNYMNQKYISSLLKKWGLNFEFAIDGLMALELAFTKPYDLIFMDISMPSMNGYDTTNALRKIENPNQDTPIIALSALAFINEKKKALKIGMTDFLGKPFTPRDLLTILNTYLEPILLEEKATTINKIIIPSPLDAKHIESLYGDDYEYAAEMFNIFIEHAKLDFEKIQSFIEQKDFNKVKDIAHKLTPNFSMAGLLLLRGKILSLEAAATEKNEQQILILHEEIKQEFNQVLPIIEQTAKRFSQAKLNHKLKI